MENHAEKLPESKMTMCCFCNTLHLISTFSRFSFFCCLLCFGWISLCFWGVFAALGSADFSHKQMFFFDPKSTRKHKISAMQTILEYWLANVINMHQIYTILKFSFRNAITIIQIYTILELAFQKRIWDNGSEASWIIW